jgi:hypothetical protein
VRERKRERERERERDMDGKVHGGFGNREFEILFYNICNFHPPFLLM